MGRGLHRVRHSQNRGCLVGVEVRLVRREEARGRALDFITLVAVELDQTFGRETFTYTNRNGNTAIAKPVLQAFKVLTATNVVWARSSRA